MSEENFADFDDPIEEENKHQVEEPKPKDISQTNTMTNTLVQNDNVIIPNKQITLGDYSEINKLIV